VHHGQRLPHLDPVAQGTDLAQTDAGVDAIGGSSAGAYVDNQPRVASLYRGIPPERFDYFYELGMSMGFDFIKSSPYTRSSYMADEYLKS